MNALAPEPAPRVVEKINFAPQALDALADEIIASADAGGSRAVRLVDSDGASVVFVAKHADARAVLIDEAQFTVGHYTGLYGSIAPPGERLIMHEPDEARALRYEILEAAARRTPWFDPRGQALATLAQATVDDLLAALRAREGRHFDVVGEYAYFVPYLIGTRVLGLAGPREAGLFQRLACFAKNFPRGRRFTPETTPYLAQLVWSQVVFGHLFGNFDNRSFLFRLAARHCETQLLAHIRRQLPGIARCDDPARQSLFSALLSDNVRQAFEPRCKGRYEDHVIALMLELMGTMQAVPGMAFAGVLQAWQHPNLDFTDRLAPLARVGQRTFVMENLRMAPPARFLLRKAAPGATVAGLRLGEGDYVCALLAKATMDPKAMARPQEIRRRKDAVYLHFGPMDGPHRCFGRHIAPIILGAMFEGLRSLPGLQAPEKMYGVGPPDRMTVTFDAVAPPAAPAPDETERLGGRRPA